jgi:hypothetical protein
LLPGAENSTAQRGSTAHLPMREKSVKIIDPAETSALANVMLSSNNSIFSSNDVITDVPRDTQTANQINRRRFVIKLVLVLYRLFLCLKKNSFFYTKNYKILQKLKKQALWRQFFLF